jgi:hypothetical protein
MRAARNTGRTGAHVGAVRNGLPPMAVASMFGVIGASLFAMPLSPNSDLVLMCGFALCVIIALLWRENEPPILLLPALFQWSEVSIQTYSTAWRGVPINETGQYGANQEVAVVYGLLGVTALACGLRFGAGQSRLRNFSERLRQEAFAWSFDRVALAAAAAILAGYAAAVGARLGGGLTQPMLIASNLKVVGLFALTYWCLVRGEKYPILAAVLTVELVFGLTGFFAEFKDTVLTILVAALAARPKVRPQDTAIVGLAAAFLIALASYWSYIKPEYRQMLNQGSGAQEVTVPVSLRLTFLYDAFFDMDGEAWGEGFERLVDRHGYTEFLALVMAYVPGTIPHEAGSLTKRVIIHIAIPRLIYPSKPALPHDTDVMAQYTGLPNLWDSNTSISIGHLGELYIDFGYLGGLVGMSAIGLMVGRVYRALRDRDDGSVLAAAGLCLFAVLPIAYFGTAYVKLIGGFVLTAIIAIGTQRVVLPTIWPYLLKIRPL